MNITGINTQVHINKYKETSKKSEKDEIKEVFTPSSQEKDWTFLVYLDATKSHDKLAFYKLKDLEKAGSDENVNIVAEVTRDKHLLDRITKDWEGTKRYYVTRGEHKKSSQIAHLYLPKHTKDIQSPPVEEIPLQDTGKPETLENFLEWGMKKYPARHYGVIISSHGSDIEGIMGDENKIDLPEFGEALKHVQEKTGKKVDLMVIDESNSANMEIATELSGKVDYLVGAEAELKGVKLSLGSSINTIKQELKNNDVNPKDASRIFVYESGRRKAASMQSPTVSVLDLNKTPEVNKALKEFSESLKSEKAENLLKDFVKKSQQFYDRSSRKEWLDLRDFIKVVARDTKRTNPFVSEKATNLDKTLDEFVVANFHEGETVTNAGGVAIYGPPIKDMAASRILKDVYPQLEMPKETGWNELIQVMSRDSKFHNFLSLLGVGEKELKILNKFCALSTQAMNLGITLGSVGLGMSSLNFFVNGTLGGTTGKALTVAFGGTQVAYGMKNTYKTLTNDEIKDKKHLADPLFYTAEGLAITSAVSLPVKLLGEIGVNVVKSIAAVGGGYHAFKGAYNIFSALKDEDLKNKREKIIDNSMESMRGLAVIATTLGVMMGLSAGITGTAGILAAAIPAARVIYNLLTDLRDLKDEDIDPLSFQEKLAQLPELSSNNAKHYLSSTTQGIITGIGQV